MDIPQAFHNDQRQCPVVNCQYQHNFQTIDECSTFEKQKRLFDLAIVENNFELMTNLMNYGYDINTKNNIGDTALITALKSMQLEVTKYLLDANAEVCRRFFEILIFNSERAGIIQYIMPSLINNLRRRKVNNNTLYEYVVGAGWNFHTILMLRNNWITRRYLLHYYKYDYRATMNMIMDACDFDNVELFLRHGNETCRYAFYEKINSFFLNKEIRLLEVYIGRLSFWNIMCKEAIVPLLFLFGVMSRDHLEILFKHKIDEQAIKKFGIDLRTALFANLNADAVEIMKYRNFNANARGYENRTALGYAVVRNVVKNVKFLLESGARVNTKTNDGRTLLFHAVECSHYESALLLLEYGADVEVIDKKGVTVFQLVANMQSVYNPEVILHNLSGSTKLKRHLIASLAIREMQGMTVKAQIQKEIIGMKEHSAFFLVACKQLVQLKKCSIEGSITLFDVLINDIQKLSRSLRDKEYISLLDRFSKIYDLYEFYYNVLRRKFMNILSLHRVKCGIATIISKKTATFIDYDHLVTEKISQYLTPYDINQFMDYTILKQCNP